MRISGRGLQHFYHAVRQENCPAKPETLLHLELKARIVKAASDAGWNVETEFADRANNWRADVLVSKGSVRIAFEVQLARIKLEDLERRHGAYDVAKVRGCWFLGPRSLRRSDLQPEKHWPEESRKTFFRHCDEPFFSLTDEGGVTVGERTDQIEAIVTDLLNRKFRYVWKRKIQRTAILRIYRISVCYACRKEFDVYFVFHKEYARCGDAERELDAAYPDEMIRRSARAQAKDCARKILDAQPKGKFSLSFPRWLTTRAGRRYLSFPCAHCDAPMSENLWPSLLEYGQYSRDESMRMSLLEEFELSTEQRQEHGGHWCYSVQRDFCE